MKAATIDRFKARAEIHNIATPALEDNAVLFRVTAAGVNPIDWKVRDGEGGKRSFPLVLGQDFAGIVDRTGKGVTRVKPGDRIFGCAREHGAYAEYSEVREGVQDSPFTHIPAGVSNAQAAALPTPGLTALASLELLGVRAGTDLLILGAAGSVGSTAVQLARERGANVTAVVKGGQEHQVQALGAKTVVAMKDDALAAIRSVRTEPFEAILDVVSDAETLKHNAPLVKQGGIVVTTVHVADEAWFRERGVRAINIVMNQTPQSSPAGLDQLAAMVADGRLVVEVASERPLSDANAVLDGLKSGHISGKVVLLP
jgi:NADPH:quinone reductase-like Zn-dependent oxidoreductase